MKTSRCLPLLISAMALPACDSGATLPPGTNLATLVSPNGCTVRVLNGTTAVDVEFSVLYVSPEPDPPPVEVEVESAGDLTAISTVTLDHGITAVTIRLDVPARPTAHTYQQRIAVDTGGAVSEFDESERDNGLVVFVPVPPAPPTDLELPCRFAHPGDATPPPVEPTNPVILDLDSALEPPIPSPRSRFAVRLEFTNQSTRDAGPFNVSVTIHRTDGRRPRVAFQDAFAIGGLRRSEVSGTTVQDGLPAGGYSLRVEIRPDGDSNVRPRIYPDRPFAI